ncbi:hypothetical protein Ctob_015285, partial [Chrysochromulina tobinii]
MPPAKNQKIWNDDLISACEARRAQASAMGSSHEFQWINAKSKIEGTAKKIYITSTDSIKNLPDGLSKTVVHYLERIIRAAQPYCNVAMELNYHAAGGRAAMMKQGWASISTLEKH